MFSKNVIIKQLNMDLCVCENYDDAGFLHEHFFTFLLISLICMLQVNSISEFIFPWGKDLPVSKINIFWFTFSYRAMRKKTFLVPDIVLG
jgi:hypothetical protein